MISPIKAIEVYKMLKEYFPLPILALLLGIIGTTIILRKRKKIAGFAIITGEYLHYMAISKKHLGKGYGKKLMERILPKIRQLRVNVNNKKAIALYESYGFRITAESRWITGKKYVMTRIT